MKKFTAISFIAAAMALLTVSTSAMTFGELGDYGQNTYSIYEAETTPVVDGIVSENEYGKPFQIITDVFDSAVSYYSLSDGIDAAAALHTSITSYMTYDDKNLYVAVVVEDPSHSTPLEGTGVWDGDYTEIDFMPIDNALDNVGNRTRYALGISDAGNVCGYYASSPDFVTDRPYANDQVISDTTYNTVTVKDGVTTYEACLPWAHILGEKPSESFLNYVQLGVAHKDMNDLSDYEAYLGSWRNIYKLSDEDVEDIAAQTGIAADALDRRSFNIMILAGKAPVETEAEVVESVEETTTTNAPATFDAVTIAAISAIVSLVGFTVSKKK